MSEREPRSDRPEREKFDRGNDNKSGGMSFGPPVRQPRPKPMKVSALGVRFIDYKENETLRRLTSGNGKLLSRKRAGSTALEQRMIAQAIKRARYMALLPYVTVTQ